MTMLDVKGLTKRFGGLTAVNDVSFDIPSGGVSAVIGPNGAGKTTLFNMIAGSMAPTSGSIVFDGAPITGLRPERVAACGLVRTFQLVQLFKTVSARENVAIGLHLRTRGGLAAAMFRPRWARRQERDAADRAQALLQFVGLGDLGDVDAGALPYGQQRLLEIARALAAAPKMLLLDEPAAGLDHRETARLIDIVQAVVEGGTTILLIEHDMPLVLKIAHTVVVLDFGRCIARGSPAEIQAHPAVLEAYLGIKGAAHA